MKRVALLLATNLAIVLVRHPPLEERIAALKAAQ